MSSAAEAVTRAPVHVAMRTKPPPPTLSPPPMYSTRPSALATEVGVPGKSSRPMVASGREPSPARRTMVRALALRAPVSRVL